MPAKLKNWLKKQPLCASIAFFVFGKSVYSTGYYDFVESFEKKDVQHIADWIYEYLKPKKVVDIGCGPGHFMAALSSKGIDVFGVDIAPEAVRRVRLKSLSAEVLDLTKRDSKIPGCPYDLAVCCEVAEHLNAKFVPTFLDKLTSVASTIFFTAAEPGSKNAKPIHHVNEQPNIYWINHMDKLNFKLDQVASDNATKKFTKCGVVYYLRSPMIFRKEG